jgi:type I restriction enzyme, S subunit
MVKEKKNIPVLRFSDFNNVYQSFKMVDLVDRVGIPVEVEAVELYQQIGIRSHGKGIFYKEPVTGKSIGNKRVFWIEANVFIVNIVFAWEHAVAKTTVNEIGMIASHRFPMYFPKEGILDLQYILYLFLTKKGKYLLEMASPGGAGRNKTLGQREFERLKLQIPSILEQKKIADFLTAVDDKIQQLTKKEQLLEQYKKGVMQKIFSQEIRFTKDDGTTYPDWEEKKLGEVAEFSKGKGISKVDICEDGHFKCIRYGELYTKYSETINHVKSRTNLSKDALVFSNKNDVIIPASGETQIDIATASCVLKDGIALGGDLNIIRSSSNGIFLSYYLNNKCKHDIARLAQGISVVHLYSSQLKSLSLSFPVNDEQQKIADILSAIDKKIESVNGQLEKTKEFKKGLLQQMFI